MRGWLRERLQRRLWSLAFIIGCAACTGCARTPWRALAQAPEPLPASIAAYYAYAEGPTEAVHFFIQAERKWREFLIQFPLSRAGFEPTEPVVELEWFESTAPGRRPAILFNPILGGDYPLERGLCRFFAGHGFHVALVHRKTVKIAPEQDIDHLELLLRQGLLRIRQVVDWMEAQESVDAQRMGSFGISMGGIASVMAAAVDPRLRVNVVALAGGGIADILIGSHDRMLVKPRAQYLQRNRLSRSELEERLRQAVRTDPIRLAPYVDSRNVLLFLALFDRTIGIRSALRLRKALGYPRTVYLPLGHYTAYLALPYLKQESLRFFQKRFQASAAPP